MWANFIGDGKALMRYLSFTSMFSNIEIDSNIYTLDIVEIVIQLDDCVIAGENTSEEKSRYFVHIKNSYVSRKIK